MTPKCTPVDAQAPDAARPAHAAEDVREFLRDLRDRISESNRSLRAAAGRAGYAPSTVSAALSAHKLPRPEFVSTLLGALEAPPEEIELWLRRRQRILDARQAADREAQLLGQVTEQVARVVAASDPPAGGVMRRRTVVGTAALAALGAALCVKVIPTDVAMFGTDPTSTSSPSTSSSGTSLSDTSSGTSSGRSSGTSSPGGAKAGTPSSGAANDTGSAHNVLLAQPARVRSTEPAPLRAKPWHGAPPSTSEAVPGERVVVLCKVGVGAEGEQTWYLLRSGDWIASDDVQLSDEGTGVLPCPERTTIGAQAARPRITATASPSTTAKRPSTTPAAARQPSADRPSAKHLSLSAKHRVPSPKHASAEHPAPAARHPSAEHPAPAAKHPSAKHPSAERPLAEQPPATRPSAAQSPARRLPSPHRRACARVVDLSDVKPAIVVPQRPAR
jgi:hypothetical protein